MKLRQVRGGWEIELDKKEWAVTKEPTGWFFRSTSIFAPPPEEFKSDEAHVVARLAKELLACRKEARVLRGDLISAYSALADLVHPKDVSMKSEHYEIVKRAHNPF